MPTASPSFAGIGPASSSFVNSALLSADDYAVLRRITGGYVIFKDSTFWRNGVIDFAYKMGSVKDTTTTDIWHFEQGSVIPVGQCNGVVSLSGGAYVIPVAAVTNGVYPYNPSGANPLQTPPTTGPTLTFGQIGDKVIARNGTLVGVISAVNRATPSITVTTGNLNTTAWTALQSGDYIYVASSVMGQYDKFVSGNAVTQNRWGVTQQTFYAATPESTMASLSQQKSYSIMGKDYNGPIYLENMYTEFAHAEAFGFLLGDGQQFTYTTPEGNSETRTEVLGLVKACKTLGNDNGTIAITAANLQRITKYNFENEGGNRIAVFGGLDVQSSLGTFCLNPANGFVINSSVNMEFRMGGQELKGIDLDFVGVKVQNTTLMLGTATEFNYPRTTSGPLSAGVDTTVYSKQALCFPMDMDLATIGNPVLTSGNTIDSTPFGFNMYYWIQRDYEGRQVGTGRMQTFDITPVNVQRATYQVSCMATALVQYVAGNRLQSFSVS